MTPTMTSTTTTPIRVLCADDHPLVRKGIASILANETDVVLVGEAGGGQEAVELFRKLKPDVVLMDLRMPEMSGIEATRVIRAEAPETKIIALTSYDGDQDIYRAIEAGVRGYILKEMVHTEVLRAIRTVHAGKRLMPAEVAERLSEYFPQMALTPREVGFCASWPKAWRTKRSPINWAPPAEPSRCTSRTSWRSWTHPIAPTP